MDGEDDVVHSGGKREVYAEREEGGEDDVGEDDFFLTDTSFF